MFKTLKNAWKVPELKFKLLFTLLIVVLYRLGANIPVPYVADAAVNTFNAYGNTLLGWLTVMNGEAFGKGTFFALSVSPYITASIVMQLLTIAIPALERLSKTGEEGRKKINSITRYVTVALALITAIGYTALFRGWPWNGKSASDWFTFGVIVSCYCAGAAIIMWMAEKINDYGIGNGVSIILFANIVARIPQLAGSIWTLIFKNGGFNGFSFWGLILAIVCIAVIVAIVALIVCVTNSERRIPIQYAKRVVGRKMYGGQGTNLPLKVNMTGVMPIIFASSIATLPGTIIGFINANTSSSAAKNSWIANFFGYTSWTYVLVNLILIVAFSYFYIMISFNPVEVANNIKDNGGSIPGIRPGKPMVDYIKKILNRVTAIGSIFLCFISCFPMIVAIIAGYLNWNIQGISMLAFGGTSILIVIGVALETVHEIEAQLTMRNYKGFLD
ncbi:MAG: preprotein translocase subunit SecY [Clostridia bacterium]|nr:preprotein translocase subunit SecY [Clostridia bacterium]